MTINPVIINILDKAINDTNRGILYLCAIYFNLSIENIFSDEFSTSINVLKIFEKDYNNDNYKWNIPLFTDWKIENDFIEEYRNLFRALDPTKASDRKTIIKKMNNFITEYPIYTKDDILKATKMYIEDYAETHSTATYLQNAKYFIKKERNPVGSKLLEWLEIMQREKDNYYD